MKYVATEQVQISPPPPPPPPPTPFGSSCDHVKMLLLLQSSVVSFRIYKIYHPFMHVYNPGAGTDNPHSIPIYPLQRVFYPQNLACTPNNDEVPYMLLYIEGTKIRNKPKCTPNFKMQWEPCPMGSSITRGFNHSDHLL